MEERVTGWIGSGSVIMPESTMVGLVAASCRGDLPRVGFLDDSGDDSGENRTLEDRLGVPSSKMLPSSSSPLRSLSSAKRLLPWAGV